MLIGSIMAVRANSYKSSLKFKYINMILSCSVHGPPDGLCPSVMLQPVSLASAHVVMLGFGITKSREEFLMLCYHQTSSLHVSFDNSVLAS